MDLTAAVVLGSVLVAAFGYLAASGSVRMRGDSWSPACDAAFLAGCAGIAVVPVLHPPVGAFTGHMIEHVVVGMVAPLLFVLSRPLTLVLRALPAGTVRRCAVRSVRSAGVSFLVFPPVAALLDVGGLWLLYRTSLFAWTHHMPMVHVVVHLHVFLAGVLFSAAVCQLEPVRRRWSVLLRAATLVAAGAAHNVLAKSLYIAPPPHTALALVDLQRGVEVMYYGGDLVEIGLALAVALQWYASGGRELARARRRASLPGVR